MFLLAHWRNTSFHAHQQQCYPSRCKKGGTEKIKGDFPWRYLSGSACRETCGHPKACKSPCTRQPDRGGTTILSCSQVRDLLSGIKPFFSVILRTRLAEQQIPQKTVLGNPQTGSDLLRGWGHSSPFGGVPEGRSEKQGDQSCYSIHITLCHGREVQPATNNLQGSCLASRVVEIEATVLVQPEWYSLASTARLTLLVPPAPWLWKAAPPFAARAPAPQGWRCWGSRRGATRGS